MSTYWQSFPTSIINTSNLLIPSPQSHYSQLTQDTWTHEVDKRKWTPEFGDLDMSSNPNKLFHMDDYNNSNNSEGDESPDSSKSSRRQDGNGYQGDQKQRRKEQNRAAQRAFRERKEKYVKELQHKIKDMDKKHSDDLVRLTQENESLKQLVKRMEAEIYTLKGAAMAFNLSISKLREAGLDVVHPIVHTPSSPPQSESPSTPPLVSKMMDEFTNTNTKNYNPFNSAMATIRDKDGFSINDRRSLNLFSDSIFDSFQRFTTNKMFGDNNIEERNLLDHDMSRFDLNQSIKMLPCSQIWEKLSQHPHFDEFDIEKLCETIKKKSTSSPNGPMISESELLNLLHKMDTKTL